MPPELIIFDCDGVLVDSEPIANRVFAEEVRKLGIPFSDQEAMQQFPGTTLAKCIEYVEQKFKVKLPESIIPDFRKRSLEVFTQELKPVTGIRELLTELQTNHCVASNGPLEKIIHNLKLTGLIDFFDDKLYSAYEIQRYKPDPELFLHAARQANMNPNNCLVIEDSIHGFIAAQAAGMQVIGYNPHGHKLPDYVIPAHSMFEIRGLLEGMSVSFR